MHTVSPKCLTRLSAVPCTGVIWRVYIPVYVTIYIWSVLLKGSSAKGLWTQSLRDDWLLQAVTSSVGRLLGAFIVRWQYWQMGKAGGRMEPTWVTRVPGTCAASWLLWSEQLSLPHAYHHDNHALPRAWRPCSEDSMHENLWRHEPKVFPLFKLFHMFDRVIKSLTYALSILIIILFQKEKILGLLSVDLHSFFLFFFK